MIFQEPPVSTRELEVIDEIDAIRKELTGGAHLLREWAGLPWRAARAWRLQAAGTAGDAGTTSPEPDTSDPVVAGYQTALTWIIHLVDEAGFICDVGILRGLHHLIVGNNLAKSPGCWRRGRISVRRDEDEGDDVIYQAPEGRLVPGLMTELVASLNTGSDTPLLVRAAMAHLNMSTIHPFLDGNGRMARAVHTLVLARGGILAPPFASIDEYLSVNSGMYDMALRSTHGGRWQPERDARPFVRFCLTAHFHQATALRRRTQEYDHLWDALETEVKRRGLPDRMVSALAEAAIGRRVTNALYRSATGISPRTATSDLRRLVAEQLLKLSRNDAQPYYVAADAVKSIHARTRDPYAIDADPFAGATD
jgi:Fic family protein